MKQKLFGTDGASLFFALAVFAVVSMISAVLIGTATAGSSSVLLQQEKEQAYLTVNSAARFVTEAIEDASVSCNYVKEIRTVRADGSRVSPDESREAPYFTAEDFTFTPGGSGIVSESVSLALRQMAAEVAAQNARKEMDPNFPAAGFRDGEAVLTLTLNSDGSVEGASYEAAYLQPAEIRLTMDASYRVTAEILVEADSGRKLPGHSLHLSFGSSAETVREEIRAGEWKEGPKGRQREERILESRYVCWPGRLMKASK